MRPDLRFVSVFGLVMLLGATPAFAWGPDGRIRQHHRVVHGKPRSVFVHPVGYAYPAIKYRDAKSGYQPLPDPVPRAALPSAPATRTRPGR